MVNSNTAAFSVNVTYTSSVGTGTAEEGVVVFYPDNASGGPQPVEMVKVLPSHVANFVAENRYT